MRSRKKFYAAFLLILSLFICRGNDSNASPCIALVSPPHSLMTIDHPELLRHAVSNALRSISKNQRIEISLLNGAAYYAANYMGLKEETQRFYAARNKGNIIVWDFRGLPPDARIIAIVRTEAYDHIGFLVATSDGSTVSYYLVTNDLVVTPVSLPQ